MQDHRPAAGIRVTASIEDLPAPVAETLDRPAAPIESVDPVDGSPWRSIAWGPASAAPVLLVHGVTSNAECFWRIGPAIAAAGHHVVAVDLPGHGRTAGWRGRHRFSETAADLAGWIRTIGLDRPGLAVLGHSWGGMVAAALPGAGIRPRTLILLDPPVQPVAALELMTRDPNERRYDSIEDAVAVLGPANPGWARGDLQAKALGLTQFDVAAVRAILLDNGAWDGGLEALADPAAAGVAGWLIRADPAVGGLVPDAAVPAFADRLGADHVLTIVGAPHSPQRTKAAATMAAILRALERSSARD